MPDVPHPVLLMASHPRSGSTFLAETIAYALQDSYGVDFFDLTRESFSDLPGVASAADVLAVHEGLRTNPWGYRCAKIMVPELSQISRLAESSPDVREVFFGLGSRWITVRRDNRIRQAVSLVRAQRTDVWHAYAPTEPAEPFDLPDSVVTDALVQTLVEDEFLREFSASLPARRISLVYETARAALPDVLEQVARLLDLPRPERLASASPGSKLVPVEQGAKQERYETYRRLLLHDVAGVLESARRPTP